MCVAGSRDCNVKDILYNIFGEFCTFFAFSLWLFFSGQSKV